MISRDTINNFVPTSELPRWEWRVKTAFAGLVRKQFGIKIYDRRPNAEIDIEWEGRAHNNACYSPTNRFLYNNNHNHNNDNNTVRGS